MSDMMMTPYFRAPIVLLYVFVALALAACKSAPITQVPEAEEGEKNAPKAVQRMSQPQKPAIGTQLGGGRQGVALNLKNVVTTLAGKVETPGAADGNLNLSTFDVPKGITSDGVYLYVADSNNHTIRKIDFANGLVSTLAGAAGKKGSADGRGQAARFNRPIGITTDGENLYVTDSNNHTIRQIDPESGVVTTLAGSAGEVGYADGSGKKARFFIPEGITSDGKNLFVSDTHNHSIRKIALESNVVTTFAGLSGAPGFLDDTGNKARFAYPKGITTDGSSVYVVDFGSHQIRKISIRGAAVNTLSLETPKSRQGGATESVKFNYPSGLTTDGRNLYVTDTFNRSIKKVALSSGVVSTIAGTPDSSGSADGTGTEAHFKDPEGITTDGSFLYVTDSTHHTIRKIR